MSRTKKGSRGPGWEPWSNRNERQKPAPDKAWDSYMDEETHMISRDEILMGRDKIAPLTQELEDNLNKLLVALNLFRVAYGKPLTVSSGYRPEVINAQIANAAKKSNHMKCLAVDFHDVDGKVKAFCLVNMKLLEQCNLYMEDPGSTPTWCHLQVVSPGSGKRVFRP